MGNVYVKVPLGPRCGTDCRRFGPVPENKSLAMSSDHHRSAVFLLAYQHQCHQWHRRRHHHQECGERNKRPQCQRKWLV